MKQSIKQSLKAKSLDVEALKKATGGRGSLCGTITHCECGHGSDRSYGCWWDPFSDQLCSWDYTTNCPNCGAAYDE